MSFHEYQVVAGKKELLTRILTDHSPRVTDSRHRKTAPKLIGNFEIWL